MTSTHIVAGIIFNQDRSQVFITKRPDHVHKGGFWEFPGGKVEWNETIEDAMKRELEEELGIFVINQSQYQHLFFDYEDKSLEFDFFCITEFRNEPFGKEGQQGKWVRLEQLHDYAFPEANRDVLNKVVREFT